ncbi:MAG: CHASE2 domain-containing protein [Cyanobacteria bacterium P01_A01_bin.15]
MKVANLKESWRDFWHQLRNSHGAVVLASLIATSGVLTLRLAGGLQGLELRVFDRMIILRPTEAPDQRIVIVGVTDADLDSYLGASTVSDQTMAQLLDKIKAQRPRVIGLDFYRSLPDGSKTDDLTTLFSQTPNLIGIEKVIGGKQDHSIPGNATLVAQDQVAASDIVVDTDGRVRRGLLFPTADDSRALEGLGLRIALDYLAGETPSLTPDLDAPVLTLNRIPFLPLEQHTGGYIDADTGGYQILLNPRQQSAAFEVVSLKQVLRNQIPPELMRDRIVLVGSMAISSADIFYTAHQKSQRELPIKFGVELHGELASQIISAALDDRVLIHAWPNWIEGLLVAGIAICGGSLAQRDSKLWQRLALIPGASLGVLGAGWAALSFTGLWLPVLPLLLALWIAAGLTGSYRTSQLQVLSGKDKLTGLANRRTFDASLQQAWFKALKSQQSLALIIGDVDHFKQYNDTYGHPQGDECLKRVAQAIRTAVGLNSALSARYGGEEFVVLLPNTSIERGVAIATAILAKLTAYNLPHASSNTASHVTMSLGVTSFIPKLEIPPSALVEMADLGLYTAKKSGRNRIVIHQPDTLSSRS